jgi:hypothetical protein
MVKALSMVWVLSIPILAAMAFYVWIRYQRTDLPAWRGVTGICSTLGVTLSWYWFLAMCRSGQIGGFGTHDLTNRSAETYFWLTGGIVALSLAFKQKSRMLAVSSGLLQMALWAGSLLVA